MQLRKFVVVVLAACLLAAPVAANPPIAFYFTEWDGFGPTGTLFASSADGSRIEPVQTDGTGAEVIVDGELASSLAIDTNGGWIYWTSGPEGESIKRARLDGYGVELVLEGLDGPRGIAIAPGGPGFPSERDLSVGSF